MCIASIARLIVSYFLFFITDLLTIFSVHYYYRRILFNLVPYFTIYGMKRVILSEKDAPLSWNKLTDRLQLRYRDQIPFVAG